jgi:hypothetical protein
MAKQITQVDDGIFFLLREKGHAVPRYGNYVIDITVRRNLTISNSKGERLRVRCTQDCPTNLVNLEHNDYKDIYEKNTPLNNKQGV